MDALAEAALRNMEDLNPHDLSGTVWAFATLSFTDRKLLQAISRASMRLLSEFNSQDLANSAWSFATCDLGQVSEDGSAMANEVQVKLAEFAPQGLATTAWAYSNFKGPKDQNLLEAISKEVMQKLYEIEPQSLGILADAKLGCQRHIEQALRPFAQRFAELLGSVTPSQNEMVNAKIFFDFVKEVRVDNFGAWGTRHIFEQMRLDTSLTDDFVLRAKEAIMKAEREEVTQKTREEVLAGAALVHRRVFAYGEYHLEIPGIQPLIGAMARENGRRARGFDQLTLLRPLASPISGLVDRSLCSEFQILATCLELAATQGELSIQVGQIQIFVSTSPCVSCLWALRQWQCYLPQVKLGVVNGEEVLAPSLRGLDG